MIKSRFSFFLSLTKCKKVVGMSKIKVKKIFPLIISRQLETGFVFFRVGREFLSFFLVFEMQFQPANEQNSRNEVKSLFSFLSKSKTCQSQSRNSTVFSRYVSWLK